MRALHGRYAAAALVPVGVAGVACGWGKGDGEDTSEETDTSRMDCFERDFCEDLSNCTLVTSDDLLVAGNEEEDGLVISVDGGADLDGDGRNDAVVGFPRADILGEPTDHGAVVVYFGGSSTGTGLADAGAVIEPSRLSSQAAFGWGLTARGDLDGDGYGDLLVASSDDTEVDEPGGVTYTFLGPITASSERTEGDGYVQAGETASLDWAVDFLGDMDGNGTSDVIVGSHTSTDDEVGMTVGRAFLMLGPITGWTSTDDAQAELRGETEGGYFGEFVAGGTDFDGDGFGDVAVGAPGDEDDLVQSGAAYVFLGPLTGTIQSSDADTIVWGDSRDGETGSCVEVLGDVNGDGVDDLGICAPRDDKERTVHVFAMPVTGTVELSESWASFTGVGWPGYWATGGEVAALGDLDGDGYASVAIGSGLGWVGLFETVESGVNDMDTEGFVFMNSTNCDFIGWSVSSAGNFLEEGGDALVTGALYSRPGAARAGAAFVLPLPF